ncbi:hypothetical protein F4782DRAFT_491358 [Xylaria castorea]|nr:hypothetical protein F4782DRAFT_491358 [Xylaria castorea]
MAFRNPVGGASLPRTFRCRVCGQNKAPAAYSKNQLQKWYNKKRNDRENNVTPENVGLSCGEHNNEEREIRCHGPCDRLKVVGQFSKNQRNDPEPWCITCTEWRLSFDGTETPNDVPNGPLVDHEDDGIRDNEEFELEPFSATSSDDEDDDDDDFDDETIPYSGGKTLVSSFVDRLEGYGDEAAGDDITTDAASTTHDVDISLWNDGTNNGRSDFGSCKSARTVTGMQPTVTQSRQTLADITMAPKSRRDAPHSQGYTVTTSNAASLSAAPTSTRVAHLTHLAAGLGLDYQTLNTQTGQFMGLGESSQNLSSRLSTTRPAPRQMNEEEIRQRPFAPPNKPTRPTKSISCKTSENQRPGKGNNNKWYKGDNRKVFPGNKKSFAVRPEDGKEAAHDSESPDEM